MKKLKSYSIILTVVLAGCYKDTQQFIADNKQNLFRLEANSLSIPADGESSITIEGLLDEMSDNRNVFFSTTNGTFRSSDTSKIEIVATESRSNKLVATSYLVSSLNVDSNVVVSVKASGIEERIEVKFTKALPNDLKVETAGGLIKKAFGAELPVEVQLFRNVGTPSIGAKVTFNVVDTTNRVIGGARAIQKSNEKGVATAVCYIKDTSAYTGLAYILAMTEVEGGTSKTDTTLIFITN